MCVYVCEGGGGGGEVVLINILVSQLSPQTKIYGSTPDSYDYTF